MVFRSKLKEARGKRQDAERRNPWLPWVKPDAGGPLPDRGGILAVIPTAGLNAARLKRCVCMLRAAAGSRPLRVVVVVSPNPGGAGLAETAVAAGDAEVVALEGPFNYPHSVNVGMSRRRSEGYVLLLNDDAFFTATGAMERLIRTLRDERWGCIGPRLVEHASGSYEGGPVVDGFPIVGACVLWEAGWLDRIGLYDETFGLGYGHDESDQTLRGRRLGMTWGLETRVQVEHENYATFGAEVVATTTEFYQRNLRRWREKWGAIGNWGGGVEWSFLPGVQVVITGHNVAPWIGRCLESVEAALAGFRWVLVVADDASWDGTADVIAGHLSSADAFVRVRFEDKAENAAQAKNRALDVASRWRATYRAVCLMDADDVMTPERVRALLWQAVDRGEQCVHGGFLAVGGEKSGQVIGPTSSQQAGAWLSPCTTLFHSSLVPENGSLFWQGLDAWEDADLFLRWWLDGVVSAPIEGTVVHEYHVRNGSVSNSGLTARRRAAWLARQAELLRGAERRAA
jgi:GT2 family glycosyltransferase